LASILQQSYAKSVNFEPFYLFIIIYLTFANTDNKNIVRTPDCRTARQNDCTYGSPLKHTDTKITMNIITQAGNR